MRKMYRLSLQIMLLLVLSCSSKPDISGVINHSELTDKKVYLLQPEKLTDVAGSYLGKIIDSASISSDGQFHFYDLPKSNSPELLEIAIQPNNKPANFLETSNPLESNYMPIIWDSKNSLEITTDWKNFQDQFSIKNPTEANKALLELRDIARQNYLKYRAGKHFDIKEGSELLSKEEAQLNFQKGLMDFAKNTDQFLPAMVALRWVSPEKDYERVPEFLVDQCQKWQKTIPDHPWTKQLCALGDPNKLPVLIGETFPNLSLPLISGDTTDVKSLLGEKLTIIDLWASWCAPCRNENREFLVPLWDHYHSKGLHIIGYGLESDASYWKTAVAKDGADRWYQASDLQGDDGVFLEKIHVRTIPANFILDDQGIVIAKNLHGKALKAFVENYLNLDE